MSYVPDPATRNQPLFVEEVEALAARGGTDIAKPRLADHFIARVLATLRMHQERMNHLHREVAAIQTKKAYESGTPTSLSPRDAVQYLSLAERADLAEETTREYLRRIGAATEQMTALVTELTRVVNVTRLAALTIEEDTTVPAEVRTRFSALLTTLPSPDAVTGWTDHAASLASQGATIVDPFSTAPSSVAPGVPVPVSPPPGVPAEPVTDVTDLDALFDDDPVPVDDWAAPAEPSAVPGTPVPPVGPPVPVPDDKGWDLPPPPGEPGPVPQPPADAWDPPSPGAAVLSPSPETDDPTRPWDAPSAVPEPLADGGAMDWDPPAPDTAWAPPAEWAPPAPPGLAPLEAEPVTGWDDPSTWPAPDRTGTGGVA